LSQAILSQSERMMRRRIADCPDGVYRNRIQVESVGDPVTLACAVSIAGDRLHVDFSGTSPSVPYSINVPLCYTRAMTCFSMKALLLPDIPNNEGSVNPIELSAPVGSILNCQPPAATAARFQIGHFVAPLIFGALAEALPDRVQADPGMMNLLNVMGRRRDGRDFTTLYFSSGGFGALLGYDGTATTPAPSNMAVVATEDWEATTNIRVVRRELRADSGGAGEFRGGLGQVVELVNDTGHPLTVFGMGARTDFPALGLQGGKPGARRLYRLNGEAVSAKGRHEMRPGDRLEMLESGAGGLGEPSRRPRQKLLQDIAEGFVTLGRAKADYGFDLAMEQSGKAAE